MSQNPLTSAQPTRAKSLPYGWLSLAGMALFISAAGLVLAGSHGAELRNLLNRLFALDSQQAMWYVTRAAGVMAYLLVWLSTVWGLAIPTKLVDRLLHRSFTFDFHQFISLLSLGFLALHIFVLTADRYLPYSLAQILVPFLSPYRPLWVGVGVIAFYLLLLVTGTFYVRQRIGMKAFRAIHYTSLLAYLGATVHGLMAGTDSSLPALLAMYVVSFLVIVFLTTYWLVLLLQNRRSVALAASVFGR